MKLPSMPKSLATAAKDNLVAVACSKDLVIIKDRRIISSINVGYDPNCIAIHPDGKELAVGGNTVSANGKENKVASVGFVSVKYN